MGAMGMVILGLDPGSQYTGYGIVVQEGDLVRHITHGVIKMSPQLSFAQKLQQLEQQFQQILTSYHPNHCAIEKIFLGKNADSAFKLGHARGVCLSQAAKLGCEVHEYAARSVKKIVTGSGAASKEQVKILVERILNIRSAAMIDATDALSLAICHSRKNEHNLRLKQLEMMNP